MPCSRAASGRAREVSRGSRRRERAIATAEIHTKRIYEPAAEEDGTRVLIMRLWPRGIAKDRIGIWLKELGPPVPLLKAFLHEGLPWSEYRPRYLAALERPEAQAQVGELRQLVRRGPITLLCGCADEQHCHRSLLKEYLTTRLL